MKIRLRDKLLAIIHKRRCSNNNCIWGNSSGVGTNGGCQSLKLNAVEARHELKALAEELLQALEESNCGCSNKAKQRRIPGRGTRMRKGN